MKRPVPIAGILFIALLLAPALSTAVIITGDVYLHGQTDHTDIKVVFQRTVPSALREPVPVRDKW
jgi:hypothetical protein